MTNPSHLSTREQAAAVREQAAAVREQAKRSFDRSWRYEALVPTGIFCVLALLGLVLSARLDGLVFAIVGALGALLSGWMGGSAARVAVPALLAGSIPLACGLGAASLGHVCIGTSCSSLCVPACAAGGVVAGVLVGRLVGRSRAPVTAMLSGAVLTCSVGALGCCCVGMSGVIGMALGFISAGGIALSLGSRKIANV